MSSPARARGAAQIWSGNNLVGNSCQRWLELSTGLRRDGGQPPSLALTASPLIWGVQGRHKGEERVPRFCLSKIGSGTGGTWSGETLSTGHPLRISAPGRRGMLLGGGVAGAEPPHKGGPNRPDRPEKQLSVVSDQWSVYGQCIGDVCEGSTRPGLYFRHARVRPQYGMHTNLLGSVQNGWWERTPARGAPTGSWGGRDCLLERPRDYA